MRPSVLTKTAPPLQQRIPALDFTKGALVLLMLLYHWLNYFIAPQGGFYRYLRFVTPSFIFITGFLISSVYLSRDARSTSRLPLRLLVRGVKLLGLFTALNVLIGLSISHSYGGTVVSSRWALQNLLAVYVTGNTLVADNAKAAAFIVLVPIGYLLVLSAGLVVLYRSYRYTFQSACACCFAGILALHIAGTKSATLDLIAIGLLGVVAGFIPLERIGRLVEQHPYLLACAVISHLTAITFWNATYPLQIVGVCLALLVLYFVGTHTSGARGLRGQILLLGKYSLFGYIAQIALLQVLYRAALFAGSGPGVLAVSFLGAFVLTTCSVQGVDRARANSVAINRLYKAVFG
jgi:peptidoglycan/LPS O-acetylase OafA/YrhL